MKTITKYDQQEHIPFKSIDASTQGITLPTIQINGFPHAFTFFNILTCYTPQGESYLTAIDVCYDHTKGIAKKNIEALIKTDPTILDKFITHVLVSNTVGCNSFNAFGQIIQADPRHSLTKYREGTLKTTRSKNSPFGKDELLFFELHPKTCIQLREACALQRAERGRYLAQCEAMIENLEDLKHSAKDLMMEFFIGEIRRITSKDKSDERRNLFIHDLNTMIKALKSDTIYQNIRRIIDELSKKQPDEPMRLAAVIELLDKIPIKKRCDLMHSSDSPALLVLMPELQEYQALSIKYSNRFLTGKPIENVDKGQKDQDLDTFVKPE
ncbi:MAG: hypothetical protein H0U75_09270 [Legionella sp.]|nr:hypothetical protein [Legionella sp.]